LLISRAWASVPDKFPAFLLAVTMIGASAAPGQATDLRNVLTGYALTSWGQKDGLPAGPAYALAQDADGYLWVGTEAGPYRFDGVRFTAGSTLGPALPARGVRALRVDAHGAIWIGFADPGGVSRLFRGQTQNFGPDQGLPASPVSMLVEDAHGGLWAGTGAGLFYFKNDRWEKYPTDRGLPEESVFTGTLLQRRGQMIVGNAVGLFRYRDDDQRFERIEVTSDIPRSIAEDPLGTLLVTDQVAGFRRAGTRQLPLGQEERGRGRQMLRDRRGNLWVGTAGQGLWRVRFDEQGRVLFTERATALTGMLSDGVLALLEDREGNIWAGTTDGINRLTPHKVTQITNIGLVAGVEATPDGGIWVGTVDEVMRFSGATTRAPNTRLSLNGSRLRSLHADPNGLVWVGTNHGLARLVDGRLVPVPVRRSQDVPRQIETITSDGHDGVWISDVERGLLRFSGGRLRSVSLPDSLARGRVVATYTDSTGRAWFAFADGQIASSDGDSVQVIGPADGVDGGVYQAIYEDRFHAIWLGGTTGLTRYSGGQFVTLHRGNGFPVSNLTAIVEDETGVLWIGSGIGIVQMDREEFDRAAASPSYQVQYRLYDRSDGLAGLPFVYSTNRRAIRARDGRLWFVTGRGLTVLDPRDLRTDDAAGPVHIEGAVADDVRFTTDSGIALPARTTRLEIAYTALSFASPLKQNFRYQLEGFDAGWIEAGNRRQAFYTNLPPRKYRFRVMSSNADGEWSGDGAVWEFSIQPTFYQTAWFMVACIAGGVLAVGGAWRLHVGQVRRRFALLIGERARLSREIHDTLLQSLVGVALQFDAMANDPDPSAERQRSRFVRMRKQVEEYIREARQSIWDLRSPKLEGQDLVTALREAGERATSSSGIGFSLTVNGLPRRYPMRAEEQILRIGQEAVVNAVRHAQAEQVAVELDFDDARLTLRVSDDGKGFDPAIVTGNGNGHYGLTSMRERAENAGGRLTVDSAIGRGTRIEATVPAAAHA
jgi:signal transduction histidine kinase/ligand-binding sensor domain-containing protein